MIPHANAGGMATGCTLLTLVTAPVSPHCPHRRGCGGSACNCRRAAPMAPAPTWRAPVSPASCAPMMPAPWRQRRPLAGPEVRPYTVLLRHCTAARRAAVSTLQAAVSLLPGGASPMDPPRTPLGVAPKHPRSARCRFLAKLRASTLWRGHRRCCGRRGRPGGPLGVTRRRAQDPKCGNCWSCTTRNGAGLCLDDALLPPPPPPSFCASNRVQQFQQHHRMPCACVCADK